MSTRLKTSVLGQIYLAFVLCAVALAQAAAPPATGGEPMGARRAEALLRILGATVEQRRSFVQENFDPQAIAKRGVNAWADILDQVHKDIGDNPPDNIELSGDRVQMAIRGPDGEPIAFNVLLGPPPESKIRGFLLGPPEDAAPPASVTEAELPQAIRELVDKAKRDGFTGQVLVANRGKVLIEQAYGEADRTVHRAMTLDTPINIASNNKMFTALLIAQLVEQGKLGWDDKAGKYLPEWPQADVREKVTIAQLLSHTSGLGEYWGPAHQAAAPTLDTLAEYGALIQADAPAAEPGKDFKYSNNGYVLLGLIAQAVTGRDYYELARERIYQPAGMTHADHYRNDDTAAAAATGYLADGSDDRQRLALRGSPAGGGYASARDLLAFANALLDGKLVQPATLARMTTAQAQMG
ncbi:MAG: serine hydrolase domain-containing protein, partial [Thiobacillus sp.]